MTPTLFDCKAETDCIPSNLTIFDNVLICKGVWYHIMMCTNLPPHRQFVVETTSRGLCAALQLPGMERHMCDIHHNLFMQAHLTLQTSRTFRTIQWPR